MPTPSPAKPPGLIRDRSDREPLIVLFLFSVFSDHGVCFCADSISRPESPLDLRTDFDGLDGFIKLPLDYRCACAVPALCFQQAISH